jgi:outer membrane lipoprotein-sorting protein
VDENRHPIADAGLGNLIATLLDRWQAELTPGESEVAIHDHARVADRACTLIETVHPRPSGDFAFHKVKVFVDREHGLPIRFEAYDWPKSAGAEPELVEEYTYSDLKTDVGLTDLDFDAANPRYAFGRF